MSKVSLGGSATGTATFDIVAPATNTNRTITLPDASGQVSVLDLRAAQPATGTAVDFLNIPATARRITVMFNGVSTNGTSNIQVQLGTTSGFETSGYSGSVTNHNGSAGTAMSAGFQMTQGLAAADQRAGLMVVQRFSENTWVEQSLTQISSGGTSGDRSTGVKSLSGPLDRVRITTANGTDVFDAGSISVMVE